MNVFVDTSSLLKLYHNEIDSDKLVKFISENEIDTFYLSDLAKIEFSSAIWKKIRSNEIDEFSGKKVIQLFNDDSRKYYWIKLSDRILEIAKNKINQYGSKGLRSLDSIQLACALSVSNDENVAYITSDDLLKSIFLDEKLDIAI